MQIVLNIHDTIDMSEFDRKMYIGVSLYEKDLMSSGLAAKTVDLEREEFILNMGKYGKSIFEITEEELKEEMLIAKQFIR